MSSEDMNSSEVENSVETLFINVNVKTPKESKSVEIENDATIEKFKVGISKAFNDAPPSNLCLIFAGKILKNENKLNELKILDKMTVHLVIKANKVTTTAPPAVAAAQPTPLPSTNSSTGTNTTSTTGGGGNPFGNFANMFGALGSGGRNNSSNTGGGGNEDVMANLQREMLSNPDMMQQMLNSPISQNLMSNPDFFRSMIQNNPQMQELMQRNPEISHMLNNPDLLRQTLEMARNPSMLQEYLRNQDRAMSNLESIPGGQSALERMFHDVQQPMMDAAQINPNPFTTANTNPNSTAEGSGSNASETGVGENSTPLPNPWSGANPSSVPSSNNSGLGGTGGGSGGGEGLQSMVDQLNSNPEMMASMMRSPQMNTVMDAMRSNPDLFNSMMSNSPLLANNPQLQEQLRSNMPNIMSQMSDPAFQSVLTNPEALQAMTMIQTGLRRLQTAAPQLFEAIGGSGLAASLGGGGANRSASSNITGSSANVASSIPPPEQRFRSQLEQLSSMGFIDTQANVQALLATFGDVNGAIDRLINSNGATSQQQPHSNTDRRQSDNQ